MKCSSAKVGTPYSKSRSTLFEASGLSENEAAYNPLKNVFHKKNVEQILL
jgi:hypothetical protein